MSAFELWLKGRGGKGQAEALQAVQRTREFLIKHGTSRFEPKGCEGMPIHNRAGWRDDRFYYIAADVWTTEVHRGADATASAKHLREAGRLNRAMGGTWRSECLSGSARGLCHSPSTLGAGDE